MIPHVNDLPPFTDTGVLPPVDCALTLRELAASLLVTGPCDGSDWDAHWRSMLVRNLSLMVGHLRQVGISDIFVDGSFAEDKPHPNDIDGYFVCEPAFCYSGELERQLKLLDPVWTWDPAQRCPLRRGGKAQLPMWHKNRVELFPHIGQSTGLVGQFGHQLTFPSAFRQTRAFEPKGIIKIVGEPS